MWAFGGPLRVHMVRPAMRGLRRVRCVLVGLAGGVGCVLPSAMATGGMRFRCGPAACRRRRQALAKGFPAQAPERPHGGSNPGPYLPKLAEVRRWLAAAFSSDLRGTGPEPVEEWTEGRFGPPKGKGGDGHGRGCGFTKRSGRAAA